jgi:pyruvate/2-oxoglutarate dehydrogenase complex dihydrolipoamide dehydrogenase (E3) component
VSETFDLAIIGAGAAGLTAAFFGARLGARVVLVERGRIGGDCTWTGCVPSKALLKLAHLAHDARRSPRPAPDGTIDMQQVRAYLRDAIERVYRPTAPDALERRGIKVALGAPSFVDRHTLRVDGRTITARRFLICTGARPAVPPISGLDRVPVQTYETFFDNDQLPRHLVVLGAGPIGLEMAQAYRRLGAAVTVVGQQLLPREEPEVQGAVAQALRREGIEIVQGTVTAAQPLNGGFALSCGSGSILGERLLVATGRRPNVDGLALEAAGVTHGPGGIPVDRYLRTSARHIYAAGDVLGGYQFSHLAGWQGFQAARNALLPGRAVGKTDVVPWVTFLDPEVAHVGQSEAQARERFPDDVVAHHWEMSRVDRAVCDGEIGGFIKVVARGNGRVLGASIVAPRAGEMIGEFTLAIRHRLTLGDVAQTIHAYPTWATSIQQAASEAAVQRFLGSALGRTATRLLGYRPRTDH